MTDNYTIDFIKGAIDSKLPVIVGLTPNSLGRTHFVAAYGYSGDTIYINDPASRISNRIALYGRKKCEGGLLSVKNQKIRILYAMIIILNFM